MIKHLLELNTLLILIDQFKELDYRFDKNGDMIISSYWEDDYNLNRMQERVNELLKEFLKPYVIKSDSKE